MAVNEIFFSRYPDSALEHQILVRTFNVDKTMTMRSLNPEDIDQLITISGILVEMPYVICNRNTFWTMRARMGRRRRSGSCVKFDSSFSCGCNDQVIVRGGGVVAGAAALSFNHFVIDEGEKLG